MVRSLSVVLKTAERCNINCDYCYFFYRGDESYRTHPPTISHQTLEGVSRFLKRGVAESGLRELNIVFHGGEPTLQRVADFDQMCSLLRDTLAVDVDALTFAIQTNGTLVDDHWVAALARHKVRVGVSLDGPRPANDAHRIDRRGRGTYERTVRGLRLLQAAAQDGRLEHAPAILSVINPTLDARDVLFHFSDDLGVKTMDFLLPDLNPDSAASCDVTAFGDYLCRLFDAWLLRRKQGVEVRIFSALLQKFIGHRSFLFDHALDPTDSADIEAITISSDGSVAPDDSMRSTSLWKHVGVRNVHQNSLLELLRSPEMRQIRAGRRHVPGDCGGCVWENICGGGFLQNRWNANAGFDSRSVYCVALKEMFLHFTAHLVSRGVDANFLRRAIGGHRQVSAAAHLSTAV
jgi:uncharacterized protein